MESFWQDVRHGVRVLGKAPGFTAVAVITLALGIGLNSALFSVINAILFRPLPVQRPESLVGVYNRAEQNFGPITHEPMAFPDYRDLRDASRTIEGMFAYALVPLVLGQGDGGEIVMGESVTENYFQTLGVRAALGRTFFPEEGKTAGESPVAVLSRPAWQRRFGGDPDVLGKTVRLNGHLFTVVGVAESGFTGLLPGIVPELWVPMQMMPMLRPTDRDRLERRDSRGIWVMGRLRPGASRAQALAELQGINERLKERFPETNRTREVDVLAASQVKFMPGLEKVLYAVSIVLLAVAALVGLIACANIAGMLLARGASRRKELAVRSAMGAGRARLVRQLLVESLLLGLAGGAAAIVLAAWSNATLNAGLTRLRLPFPVPLHLGLEIDHRVLLFNLALAALTTVACGLTPALAATRADVVTAIKEETGTTTGSRGKYRMRSALVVVQVAVSLVLLIGAGLSLRSAWNAHRVDPGFDARGVVVASTDHTLRDHAPAQAEETYRRLAERVRGLPGVESLAYAAMLPLTFEVRDTHVTHGKDARPEKDWPTVDASPIGPGYFATMRIPILRGRDFTDHDREGARVVIVNEALAARFWPGQDPIGQRVRIRGSKEPHEVVGLARDSKYRTLGESHRPYVYQVLPREYPGAHTLIVRVTSDSRAALAAIRDELRGADEKLPVLGLRTLEEATSVALLLPRAGAVLFGLFGALGLTLAAVGLYGLVAYVTAQRNHEIGIRLALGAQRRDILRLVVGQGMRLTAIGLIIGLAGALALTRVIAVMLYGVGPTDVVTFAGISLLLSGVAAFACYIPARRVIRLDPMTALRRE